MRFSIVIPAHNGERYLRSTIESTLQQTRLADEVLLIDDASADATAEIAKSYGSEIKYHFNQKATGFVDAWNRAIELSSGDFVAILHQDDLFHPDYLKYIERAINQFPGVKHFYAGCNYIDSNGNIIGRTAGPDSTEPILYSGKEYTHNYLSGVVARKHIHRCPGTMTKRTLLLNECTYRKEAGLIADDDLFYRIGGYTDVVGISQPLASYRIHATSATGSLEFLSLKLAEDYVFQTKYYKDNETHMESEDIVKLNKLAVKHINLLLFYSISHRNKIWCENAFRLRSQIDQMLPSFTLKNQPAWSRIMWSMTSVSCRQNIIATIYARALNMVIKTRKYFLVKFVK